jgi:uncharacterized protein (UPF0261 family)
MSETREALQDYAPRITAAAKAVADAEHALAAERELRRRVVVDAVEDGMSQRGVAAALKAGGAGGTGLVHKILATAPPEDDQ